LDGIHDPMKPNRTTSGASLTPQPAKGRVSMPFGV
jgi:hypothetical protein